MRPASTRPSLIDMLFPERRRGFEPVPTADVEFSDDDARSRRSSASTSGRSVGLSPVSSSGTLYLPSFQRGVNMHRLLADIDSLLLIRTVRGLFSSPLAVHRAGSGAGGGAMSSRSGSSAHSGVSGDGLPDEFVRVTSRSNPSAAIFQLYEVTEGCARACLGPQRPFECIIQSPVDGSVAMRIERPFRSWRTEAAIRDSDDRLLGSLWQYCTACHHTFVLRDADGEDRLRIFTHCCTPFHLAIAPMVPDSEPIGSIRKVYGYIDEFGRRENKVPRVEIDFGQIDPLLRGLVLAAAQVLDVAVFGLHPR